MSSKFFSVSGVLQLLQAVGPITAALPEFKSVFKGIVDTFEKPHDQSVLRMGYYELQQENSGGHTRLQGMLEEAQRAESS